MLSAVFKFSFENIYSTTFFKGETSALRYLTAEMLSFCYILWINSDLVFFKL